MSAAILCPGPSLTRLWPGQEPHFSCVIAVNRAALLFPHDWLMMMDNCPIAVSIVASAVPRVGYLFPPQVACLAWNKPGETCNPRQWMPARKTMRPLSLTGPTAMLAAHGLGHTDIHIFGNDMRGSVYADGTRVDADDVLAVRWSAEPRQWDRAADYLRGKGCTVTFHREPT